MTDHPDVGDPYPYEPLFTSPPYDLGRLIDSLEPIRRLERDGFLRIVADDPDAGWVTFTRTRLPDGTIVTTQKRDGCTRSTRSPR